MTDFLTSLTARSFGTETAIRPRVASLFEPVRNGHAALREAPAVEPIDTAIAREVVVDSEGERKMSRPAPALREDDTASDAKHTAGESPVAAVVSQPHGESARRRTTVLADETREREKEDTVVAAKVRPRRALVSQEENAKESEPALRGDSEDGTPKSVSTREKEDTVVAAKVRPRTALVSQEENAKESEPALRRDSEDGTPKRVSTSAVAVSALRDESAENDHRGLVLPPRVFPELTAQIKHAALAVNVRPGAPKREKAGRAAPALAVEPEPSVQVTIGRIEVRATSESKQVGRPRTASPAMSLEEYLRRRTQRGGQ